MSEASTQTIPTPNQEPQPQGPISEVVKELIRDGRPDTIKGLELTVDMVSANYPFSDPGEMPATKRYVVRDIEEVTLKKPRMVKYGLPTAYFGGKDLVPDEELEDPEGRDRNFIPDLSLKIGRRSKLDEKPVVKEPRFIIEKFNTLGHPEDILVYTESQLVDLIARNEEKDRIKADWNTQSAEPPSGNRIDLNLRGDEDDTFNALSEQLAGRGIYDMAGLSWKTTVRDNKTGGTKVRVMKIAMEDLVNKGPDTKKPRRAFLVLEYDETKRTLYSCKILKDDALEKHFKGTKRTFTEKMGKEKDLVGQISDVSITPRAAPPETISAEEMEAARGWAEEVAMDREGTLAELLSYTDIIDPASEDADSKKKAKLAEFKNSREYNKRLDALGALVDAYGMPGIYLLAAKLRDDFLQTARELDIAADFVIPTESHQPNPPQINGASISWILASLADRHHYAQHRHNKTAKKYDGLALGDPFVSVAGANGPRLETTRQTERMKREMVSEQLGLALVSQTMHKAAKQKTPKTVKTRKGDVDVMEYIMVFDEDALDKLPKLTREPIKEKAERVYEHLTNAEDIRLPDLVRLGELMRRGLGL